MVRIPGFLRVLPDDISRAGVNGAVLLALIRYATAIENGHDRIIIDGHVWWRASHNDIAASCTSRSWPRSPTSAV